MSEIYVCGSGAVSPAGWTVASLRDAIEKNEPIEKKRLSRPGWDNPLITRQVPPPSPRPAFASHLRLRRTSPVSLYAVGAAMEALGADAGLVNTGKLRLGIVMTVLSGCVNYSRRFYDETLRDPTTASPLLFPETVFNAPSSHIAALLGTTAPNYTLVGDPATFLQGLALAADWLLNDRVDGCLVIGAEELDWLIADAFRLFVRKIIISDGAGALYLRREPASGKAFQLRAITDAQLFSGQQTRHEAAQKVRAQMAPLNDSDLLCDGLQDLPRYDEAEESAWNDWNGARISPKKILGEGLMAAAAWQCVAAVDALRQNGFRRAVVSVVGCNQQAIGAEFST